MIKMDLTGDTKEIFDVLGLNSDAPGIVKIEVFVKGDGNGERIAILQVPLPYHAFANGIHAEVAWEPQELIPLTSPQFMALEMGKLLHNPKYDGIDVQWLFDFFKALSKPGHHHNLADEEKAGRILEELNTRRDA